MSVLNVDGINFSDGTALNSKYGIIPQNSISIFYQAAAPTGWTKITTHNDKALRVVSGTGGGSGGTLAFSSVFTSNIPISGSVTASGTVGETTLTIDQLPTHAHNSGSSVNVRPGTPGVTTRALDTNAPAGGDAGGGNSHTHPFEGTAAPYSTSFNLNVNYLDVIICRFN